MTRKEFYFKYRPFAIEITEGTGVFPLTLLTAAIVESQGKDSKGNWIPANNASARLAKNLFGIKADRNWKGKKILLPTPNDADKQSFFRVYNSFEDSLEDYLNFLKKNPRYSKALKAKSPTEQFKEIAAAGYAEGAGYAELLTIVSKGLKKYGDVLPKTSAGNTFTILLVICIGIYIIAA